MKKSPLAQVKDRFENKKKLVDAVRALATKDLWIDRVEEDKGLEHVSNEKLLHLHDVLTAVKKEFGTRAKLIDALLAAEKRTKDKGLRDRFEKQSTPRLYDAMRAAQKRAKAAN